MLMLMSVVETRQMYSIKTGQRPVAIVDICLDSLADICPVSTADIGISIDHSESAFRINNQHIMEAATAADLTQASEIAVRYITLGSRVMYRKGYASDLTVGILISLNPCFESHHWVVSYPFLVNVT